MTSDQKTHALQWRTMHTSTERRRVLT